MNKKNVQYAREFQQMHTLSTADIQWNLSSEELTQLSVAQGDAHLCQSGAIAVQTGKFTGRSPKDRFLVKDSITVISVDWGEINIPLSPASFELLYADMMSFLQHKKLYGRQVHACDVPKYRMNINVITETAWSNLFVHNMFLEPSENSLDRYENDWSIFCIPSFLADPERHNTRAENFSVVNFSRKMILIGGTAYTGEIKKGIFSVLNFLLPTYKNTLSMHCSANVGSRGDTALFFGLSGTGKTTLSSCADRKLIGDDEHGWSPENQIFNFEGGCYAKTIDLDPKKEPEIYQAIRPGALLENIGFYPDSNKVDFTDDRTTENTRVSYPLSHLNNIQQPSVGEAPRHIFFLSCDAFGVLPPLSKLSPKQAIVQFLLGYTAKVAGTESDVQEPQAVFSTCFGAPFMPLHPTVYGDLLEKKINEQQTEVWLVNTGWIGGAYGVGNRIALRHTRALIDAVLNEQLTDCSFSESPTFGFQIPDRCPGVPDELLNPRHLWDRPTAYDRQASRLKQDFDDHLSRFLVQKS